jgi:hypothetical protein
MKSLKNMLSALNPFRKSKRRISRRKKTMRRKLGEKNSKKRYKMRGG